MDDEIIHILFSFYFDICCFIHMISQLSLSSTSLTKKKKKDHMQVYSHHYAYINAQ